MAGLGTVNLNVGMQVFSVAARSMAFRDQHMRSSTDATWDFVPVAANCLLIKNAGPQNNLTILCDSGPGLHLPSKVRNKFQISDRDILSENLAKLGVGVDDINVYLPSHLHWDHTGWAFEAGRFILPNAHVVMSEQALRDNNRVDSEDDASFLPEVPGLLSALQNQGRLTLIDAEQHPLHGDGAALDLLGDSIRFYFSRGHSEGQMHAKFSTQHGSIVFGGDFWPTAWHAQDPERYMPMFDKRDADKLIANKNIFIDQVVRGGWHLHFYHDPQVLSAQVTHVGGSYSLKNQASRVAWE